MNMFARGFVALVLLCASLGAAETPPQKSAVVAEFSLPTIKSWVPAAFPPNQPPSVRFGTATIRLVIDEAGAIQAARVLEASAPVFGETALAAVKQWTFTPGTNEGKPATMCVDVPFELFVAPRAKPGLLPPPHLWPRAATSTKAAVKDAPLGDYPKSLNGRGLPGEVAFACLVGADGRASQPKILRASHVDYAMAALASFDRWTFSPAMQGDLPIAAELRGNVEFGELPPPTAARVLATNGITALDGQPPEERPAPIAIADPVWPHEPLLRGEGGSASVEFTVLGNGRVTGVRVREASDPAFGEALAAAVDLWVFRPATSGGRGVEVTLLKSATFKPVPIAEGKNERDPLARIVRLARAGSIGSAAGLDEKLTPIYRVPPAAPERWHDHPEKRAGRATIEFVIDREGRARLPRIVDASEPEFGWAAATAIGQWIFKAPRRNGEPVDVKVQIPVQF